MAKGYWDHTPEHSENARKRGRAGGRTKQTAKWKNLAQVHNMTNKELAREYRKKAYEESQKEHPDKNAFNYYCNQAKYYQRLKPVYVPASMVKKESKAEIEKDYASV